MQILVLYYSKGGNTKKLAEAVARGVEQVDDVSALLRRTEAVSKDDFTGSAGIIAGSPVYFGLMAAEMKKVFDDFVGVRRKMENKIGAAFTTAGDPQSATGHYGTACVGEPDDKTIENGMKLGRRVAELARKIGA